MSMRKAIGKFYKGIFSSENDIDNGSLYLSVCLFFFIKSHDDTKEMLWEKFCESVKASCIGDIEQEQERKINYCMRKIGKTANSIQNLSENDFSNVIDDQYRSLFLPALYLRYSLFHNGKIGDIAFKMLKLSTGSELRINPDIFKILNEDFLYLMNVISLDFEKYLEELHKIGEQIIKDTNSKIFAISVSGFKKNFGRSPSLSLDFSVGYYLAISEIVLQ